jgi:hypothetical protein
MILDFSGEVPYNLLHCCSSSFGKFRHCSCQFWRKFTFLKPLYEVEGLSSFHLCLSRSLSLSPSLSLSLPLSLPVLCTFQALWLVDTDQSGYIATALIGQNKGALRPPTGLSRVSHPHICPCTLYNCTEAGINSCVTVPSKVCALQVSTKTLESRTNVQRLK